MEKHTTTGSNPGHGFEHGGQSDMETPEPIPNSEDKPVHVLHCTQMRELSGTADRCHAHLTFFCIFNWGLGCQITIILNSVAFVSMCLRGDRHALAHKDTKEQRMVHVSFLR